METSYQNWLWKQIGEKTVGNLKKHGFQATYFSSVNEAVPFILGQVDTFASFGFAGSDTTRSLGLLHRLQETGKTIFDHWSEGLSADESLQIRQKQSQSDCFFCSANAITQNGEIVNVDGVGNRTNAMSFGPKQVFVIAGMNKITKDLDSAIKRVHEVAAPMRAKSLGMDTPCGKTGICSDCNSPQRLCRITTILHRQPMLTKISVVLIGEHLGF